MNLSDVKCRGAKPKNKIYRLSDGNSLFLEIQPNGKKYWRLRYRFRGKEKMLAIGTYPQVSLSHARDECIDAKRLLRTGIDPTLERQKQKLLSEIASKNSFKSIALEWLDKQTGVWTDKHTKNVLRKLERDIFPYLGKVPISEIEPLTLLPVLRKIEKRGALDVLGRVRNICSQVFRYGVQTGRCQRDVTQDLKGAFKTKKTTHFQAITFKELPEFLNTLERNEARLFTSTRRAIWLSLLTFVRPGELRTMRWEDIDLKERLWTIPADSTKQSRDHIVPLSNQTINIIKAQMEELESINTPWVFPSQIGFKKPMSNGTVLVAIKRLGYHGRMTAHGFRALARTTIREKLRYDSEIIERQLGHKPSGSLGAAYDRTEFLEDRVKMMQDWADLITKDCH